MMGVLVPTSSQMGTHWVVEKTRMCIAIFPLSWLLTPLSWLSPRDPPRNTWHFPSAPPACHRAPDLHGTCCRIWRSSPLSEPPETRSTWSQLETELGRGKKDTWIMHDYIYICKCIYIYTWKYILYTWIIYIYIHIRIHLETCSFHRALQARPVTSPAGLMACRRRPRIVHRPGPMPAAALWRWSYRLP